MASATATSSDGGARARAAAQHRSNAHMLHREGEQHEAAGQLAAAVTRYEAAVAALRRAGPPSEDEGPVVPFLARLTLCNALNSLGLARARTGNPLEAARCYAAALDSAEAWPEPPEERVGEISSPMMVCTNLCCMHIDAGDKVKGRARLRQFRKMLDAAGVPVPSDTHAYVRYGSLALPLEPAAVDADELLAAARRVHPRPALEVVGFLLDAAEAAKSAKDIVRARALLEEALELARANSGAEPRELEATALSRLASLHGPVAGSTAEKCALLRAIGEAAACFTTAEAQLCDKFAAHIADLSERSLEIGVSTDKLPDVRVTLRRGAVRQVSLRDPDGWGRIALSEEAVSIFEALHGKEWPSLLPHLSNLCHLCFIHGDLLGARDVAERSAALALRVLPAGHASIVDTRSNADTFAEQLADVLRSMRSTGGSSAGAPSRRDVQRAALAARPVELRRGGGTAGIAVSSLLDLAASLAETSVSATTLKAGASRAAIRDATPCAGCGAAKPDAATAFKFCAACKAVMYCSRECQKAHWKKHKRECAALSSAGAGAA